MGTCVRPPLAGSDIAGTTERVTRVVSSVLRVESDALDPQRALSVYGLDSLTSMELVARLEDEFRTSLPEWLIAEYPDIDALGGLLASGHSRHAVSLVERMRRDSVLPNDIQLVVGDPLDPPRAILMTGATGFLGAYLLRELLDSTTASVWCLVRGEPGEGLERIQRNLERFGLYVSDLATRIVIVAGDLERPDLGLQSSDRVVLAQTMDAIYHVGAVVDWTRSYAALADANVTATREIVRLACASRPKVLHFVSSLSVCYADGGPAVVGEASDMLPFADRLPLGYAQTKAVAESLVRQATARGLRAYIHRPSLIAGDSTSGASNVDDLLAALVKGCIQMGTAPDLDWTVDAAPVDHVARAIVRLPGGRNCSKAFHLINSHTRHWRECVLWINLFGYPCRLLPYDLWVAQLERDSRAPSHALHRLRGFFLRRVPGGATGPELYENGRRSQVDSSHTLAVEASAGLACPRLDGQLLDRYFQDYIARGFLAAPVAGSWSPRPSGTAAAHRDIDRLSRVLRAHFEDETISVLENEVLGSGSAHSIIGELTGWRQGQRTGLFQCRLSLEQRGVTRDLPVMIKAKAADTDVMEVGETIAAMCGVRLGQAVRDHREQIGLRASHIRELAIYDRAGARMRPYMPTCFGTWRDDDTAEWGLVLERLEGMALMDAVDDPEAWSAQHIETAMRGLGELHAAWSPEVVDLERQPWMAAPFSRARATAMGPLWRALADHAAPLFSTWAGESIADTHQMLVATIDDWWTGIDDSPRTLIHNDCNPRNVAMRYDAGGYRLCAYDWELATIGPPQRDAIELLAFVLPSDVSRDDLDRHIDQHRLAFTGAGGYAVSPEIWRAGVQATLAELLINRLAFYAMIHRVRPQAFLPRVIRTWTRLFDLLA